MSESTGSATVTVFGGSSCKEGSDVYDLAYRLGSRLGARGLRLCNGGYGGTMEAAARGARESGGATVGITLKGERRRANRWIRDVRPQPGHRDRMETLIAEGDGYVVLPGGTGTLAELGVLLESINKGLIRRKPVVFLGRFWWPLLDLLSGERVLRNEAGFSPTEGVVVTGAVARTDDPGAAAQYLAVNLLSGG